MEPTTDVAIANANIKDTTAKPTATLAVSSTQLVLFNQVLYFDSSDAPIHDLIQPIEKAGGVVSYEWSDSITIAVCDYKTPLFCQAMQTDKIVVATRYWLDSIVSTGIWIDPIYHPLHYPIPMIPVMLFIDLLILLWIFVDS